jgi:hypothetical protein
MVVYENDKRYIIPFDIIEKFVTPEIADRIKTEALKEVNKL